MDDVNGLAANDSLEAGNRGVEPTLTSERNNNKSQLNAEAGVLNHQENKA